MRRVGPVKRCLGIGRGQQRLGTPEGKGQVERGLVLSLPPPPPPNQGADSGVAGAKSGGLTRGGAHALNSGWVFDHTHALISGWVFGAGSSSTTEVVAGLNVWRNGDCVLVGERWQPSGDSRCPLSPVLSASACVGVGVGVGVGVNVGLGVCVCACACVLVVERWQPCDGSCCSLVCLTVPSFGGVHALS